MQEQGRMQGREVGVILCGGNIDKGWMATILQGGTPSV
jgi:threonine dehydratase